ncbi:hypothetical protein HIM_09841 [Hirsutella minnesotensis 3608]|uniref:Uncharacterized protein n=1 Tax=Hirsutella minnesotensis 3608 TaxID=1043627 RepID=A0A0F7ZXI0_9HYPO|nr:hypothetical protein HIM_09841 [Hirsutella minnesotensis 3608]
MLHDPVENLAWESESTSTYSSSDEESPESSSITDGEQLPGETSDEADGLREEWLRMIDSIICKLEALRLLLEAEDDHSSYSSEG